MLAAVIAFAGLPLVAPDAHNASAATVTASGRISDSGVNLRQSANTSSKVLGSLKKNTKLTIYKEIFTSKTSTAADKRWYYVSAGSKTGYVRADLVKDITWGNIAAVTTDGLNCRKGPSTAFKAITTVGADTGIALQLPAAMSGSNELWYRVSVNGSTAYVISQYVKQGSSAFITKSEAELRGKSELAKSLLSNPSRGGKARVVYTFDSSNCKKLFAVKGYKNAKVPQGLAFTGSEYYVLYGMAAGQSIVTYSASGQRLNASKFSFCIGHPNGITWDPKTKMCYIFKGNQKRIYTWNPSSNVFGKSKTPYSSSGVGYDGVTGLLYATSRSGVRAYSADGSFAHQRLFARCSHGIFHYTQDCGAGEGFIFHGISGASKKTVNYVDIYRAADSAYLGSIKVTMGEIESAVVGNDGSLQLLINNNGNTDYIWKTPLNVKELK